jgi:hypothetical protein
MKELEKYIDNAVSYAWCENNKNIIELLYDINPNYVNEHI